jgi:hypothetical protein
MAAALGQVRVVSRDRTMKDVLSQACLCEDISFQANSGRCFVGVPVVDHIFLRLGMGQDSSYPIVRGGDSVRGHGVHHTLSQSRPVRIEGGLWRCIKFFWPFVLGYS